MSEERRCQLRALLDKEWGKVDSKPELRLVGGTAAHPTGAETFHDASLSIAEFGQRWREGNASLSEMEDADVLLLGLRRLLADARITP